MHYVCLMSKEVCKSNNITDHQQAVDNAVLAALSQPAYKDIIEEAASAAVNSDDQQLIDDQVASSEDVKLPKEDL